MATRWLICGGVLWVASSSSMMIGCSKSEPPKPPPGVTKEMEDVKLPTIDLGTPTGGPELVPPAKPDAKTKQR